MIELLIEAERAMSVGLVDRAAVLYRQVLTADPRNAIAVVGLARVALEQGDEPAALGLARDALTLDPENDKARRLEERLVEVLRTRGVDVPDAPAAQPVPAPPPAAETPVQPPRKRSLLDRLRRRG